MTNLMVSAFNPEFSVDQYLKEIRTIPRLSNEEELKLAQDWYYNKNINAAHTLIVSHLPFVVFIARKFGYYNELLADLIQEGNIGLMNAVKRYNPESGVKVATYASLFVKGAIQAYIAKNFNTIKIASSSDQIRLFFKLKNHKNSLKWATDWELKAIAQETNIPIHTVKEMYERIRTEYTTLYDDEENPIEIACNKYDPEIIIEKNDWEEFCTDTMNKVLATVSERDRNIVKDRWFKESGNTFMELSHKYGITFQRVKQIEDSIAKQIKSKVNEERLICY